MKNTIHSRYTPFVRKLKPKPTLAKRALSIQNISFSYHEDGITFVKIYPSQISIASRELIEMIEEKKDSIPIEDNTCVLREDILFAVNNFLCGDDNSTTTNHNTMNTTQSSEPKRPTNAFILYRSALRKKIKILFPSFSNTDVSKFIGAMWNAANKEVKEKYIKQAMECRKLHKQKYPNFEYNIKKENVDQSVSNCEQYSMMNDNWDNYFDWCLQNAAITAAGNNIPEELDSKPSSAHLSWNNFSSGFNADLFNSENWSIGDYQGPNEWNEVCNIVSEFFPEDSDQNTLIDDKLWASLGGIELMPSDECGILSYFENNVIGYREEQK